MILKELEYFNRFIFVDESHYYYNRFDLDTKYSTGTGFIKKFQKPYDSEYYATNKANKFKVSKDTLLEQWGLMAKVGKHRGTIVHNYCENLWSNKIFPIYHPNWIMRLPTEETITYIRSVNKCIEMANGFFEGYRERFIPVKLEFVLGDEDAKIISMIDLLAYDIVKDCLVILDYKTDKRFNKTSPFGNKFLEPISHLDDCEFNKYSLQLSLYKYIIEKNSNLKIEDMYVVWMFHKNDTYKVIEIPYMEKELKLMLECHD